MGEELRKTGIDMIGEEKIFFQTSLLDQVRNAVIATDLDGKIIYWNRCAENLYQCKGGEVLGKSLVEVMEPKLLATLKQSDYWEGELIGKRKDGSTFPILQTNSVIRDEKGKAIGLVSVSADISEKKHLEERLLQLQKMEAIGLLAGGIAHDFNNLLMLILGNVELGLMRLEPSHPLYDIFTKIQESVKKASALSQKLLAFGRRQVLQPKMLNVAQLVVHLSERFERVLGENVELKKEFEPNLGQVYADQGSLEQVIMNLTVNARDAMPQGGLLTIQAQNIYLEEKFCCLHPYMKPGNYVKISLIDTGMGMDEKTLQRIFDPFFTTKEQGRGLGLAVVYGIMKQHKSYILASSQPGQGSRFDLYFPLERELVIQEALDRLKKSVPQGMETLLVAEDESEVRNLFRAFLEELGYKVFLASNGEEALELFYAYHQKIDLVILDAVMPKMSGPKAYHQMKSLCPNLPCLFLTGYSEEVVQSHFDQNSEIQVLRKPVTFEGLGQKVRKILDQAGKRYR